MTTATLQKSPTNDTRPMQGPSDSRRSALHGLQMDILTAARRAGIGLRGVHRLVAVADSRTLSIDAAGRTLTYGERSRVLDFAAELPEIRFDAPAFLTVVNEEEPSYG